MAGDTAEWGPLEHLVATVIDVLQVANWQRSDTRKSRRPRPIDRPGVDRADRRTFGSRRDAVSIAEMREIQRNWGR